MFIFATSTIVNEQKIDKNLIKSKNGKKKILLKKKFMTGQLSQIIIF